jgi:3'-5' exoribonuclease
MTPDEQLALNAEFTVRKKQIFASELTPGAEIEDYFFLEELSRQNKKSGGSFWSGKLRDRTGTVDLKIWDEAGEAAESWVGLYVKVRASAKEYKKKIELHASKIRLLEPPETVDLADFTPVGPEDRFKQMRILTMEIDSIHDSALRGLCRRVIDDPGLHDAFRDSPAAKSNHQCYVGGLIDHALSLIGLAHRVTQHYTIEKIDRDILVTVCIFHDIGKTKELRVSPAIGYTAEGSLIGHVGISMEMLDRLAPVFWANLPDGADLEVYQDKWLHLRHIIASHHGHKDWGAIAEPLTREAMLFHLLDMIDSRAMGLFDVIEREKQDEDGFFPFNHAAGGRAWRPKR